MDDKLCHKLDHVRYVFGCLVIIWVVIAALIRLEAWPYSPNSGLLSTSPKVTSYGLALIVLGQKFEDFSNFIAVFFRASIFILSEVSIFLFDCFGGLIAGASTFKSSDRIICAKLDHEYYFE